MADWEAYREVLTGLYLRENKSLKEVMEHMKKTYKFAPGKYKYESYFKKWHLHKNMTKSEWLYAARKIEARKPGKSAVYWQGVMVSPSKVKKEVSRQVHPNDFYSFGDLPPSPGNVTVCTPPPDDFISEPDFKLALTRRKRLRNDSPIQELSAYKRQHMLVIHTSSHKNGESSSVANGRSWPNNFFRTQTVDITGLPYLQFREIMNSKDVIKGFEQILTIDDSLCENMIGHFWPQPPSSTPNHLLLCESPSTSNPESGMYDTWEFMQYPGFQAMGMSSLKPFGFNFVVSSYDYNHLDTFECIQLVNRDLPSLLANMPHTNDKEVQVLTDLLLGPPTIEAARRFVEVGIYFSSNNVVGKGDMDKFIASMLQTISWSTLRTVLSAPVPTIQAFAESVFKFAIATENIKIFQDLLYQKSFRKLVRSNGEILVLAVRTSNAEVVNLMLDAGANPNNRSSGLILPLSEAKTAEIARLLVQAGANVNATGNHHSISTFAGGLRHWNGPLVLWAAEVGNIEMTRYLINAGADVNVSGTVSRDPGINKLITALQLAVHSGNIEVIKLLLQSGANTNQVIYGCTVVKCGYDGFFCTDTTVLQMSAALGNLDIIKLLLQHGADVNAPALGRNGETALQAAVSRGDVGIVRYLFKNGAEVNAPGNSDIEFPRSVLTSAVEMGHYELVEIILAAGAEVNILSYGTFGCMALDSAKCRPNNSDIYKLLESRGAVHSTQVNISYHQAVSHQNQAQLREAILKNDVKSVKNLIDSGIKIGMGYFKTKEHHKKTTILQFAVARSKDTTTEIFQLLFNKIKEADKRIDFYPILIEATINRKLDILAILLDVGADINATHDTESEYSGTPLMYAVDKKDVDTVLFLLDRGADVNMVVSQFKRSPYVYAATSALQASFVGYYGQYDRQAAQKIFYLLIRYGAKPNAPVAKSRGRSELACAVWTGNFAIVEHLLKIGAEVNSPPAEMYGRTALQAAAELSPANIPIVQLLLDWGADVNAPAASGDGYTALGAAATRGHFQIAVILLQAGADLNARNLHGFTPIVLAALYGRLDMVYLLLKAGADNDLPKNERYVKAAETARDTGHIAIVAIIEKWKEDERLRCSTDTTQTQSKGQERAVDL